MIGRDLRVNRANTGLRDDGSIYGTRDVASRSPRDVGAHFLRRTDTQCAHDATSRRRRSNIKCDFIIVSTLLHARGRTVLSTTSVRLPYPRLAGEARRNDRPGATALKRFERATDDDNKFIMINSERIDRSDIALAQIYSNQIRKNNFLWI